jgi:hypothetical protein
MLSKLTGLGCVILSLSLGLGVACTTSKDKATGDGGSGGNGAGTGGTNDTGGSGGSHAGSGGSAGHGGNGTGGTDTDGGTAGHGGAGGASTGGSATSDSGATGGSSTIDSGSTGGASTTDSGSTATNVLTNPGFEDGVMDPWTSLSSNFIVDGDAPRSGSYDAKLYSGFGDPTWAETMSGEALLLAAGTYTFHVWVEKAGTGTLTALSLEASSSGATKTLDILSNVSGSYQEFTMSGITVTSSSGPNLGACAVRVVAAGDKMVSVYVDDASLTKDP